MLAFGYVKITIPESLFARSSEIVVLVDSWVEMGVEEENFELMEDDESV